MAVPAAPGGGAPRHRTGTALVRVTQPELARRALLERTRGRLVLAASGFGLLFGAVAFKLAVATVFDPAQPRRTAAAAGVAPAPPRQGAEGGAPAAAPAPRTAGRRAPIVDRNGELLAVSLPIAALAANPREILDPVEAADRLRTVLPELDRERLIQRLSGDRQFVYIHRSLTPRQQQAVNDLGIAGVFFEEAERRYYPQGRAAVHVLGTVDVDGNGIAGVERSFDERLRRGGEPLRLSLDLRVQLALRDAVQHAITEFNGIGGAGVLMDVNTGEVLGMVSLPDYDPSDPAAQQQPGGGGTPAGQSEREREREQRERQSNDPRFNRVTVGVYEPGSTFKLMTAAMALEYGTVQPWGGYSAAAPIRYGRFTINDFKGKGRWLALPEIIAYSSNIASAHMAAAVGPSRHREFLVRMGMAARLQIELPERALPLVPRPQDWREINTMTIGFGHGISVTPLHVVTGVAALANGGIYRQPTLLAQPPGTVREGTRVVSEGTSNLLRRLMRLVVTEGSGRSAEVPGYFVGGKTGTAQKTGPRGGYLPNKRIAAFVGAFPIHAPRYALYVMVDEPKPNARSHGYATAGWVAAPAAHMVISRVAPILGLLPETDRAQEIAQQIAMPMNGRIAPPPMGARPEWVLAQQAAAAAAAQQAAAGRAGASGARGGAARPARGPSPAAG
ncbi:peptidoglycan D,D-transpeptidase FtsI family protein, partial [Caldovatus aquaticus]|nr:penicillin-binding protein 2 [Caldovatus aquaticus]